MNERLRILVRYVDDWAEIYLEGELTYEGSSSNMEFGIKMLRSLTGWLNEAHDWDIEYRVFKSDYEFNEEVDKNYNPPLFTITGEKYWSDWDRAERME